MTSKDTNPLSVPEPDARDNLHWLVTKLVSPVPYASDLISAIVKSPIENRRKNWEEALANGLIELMKKFENISPESLSQNEVFISTVMDLTLVALRTHQQEKLRYLRNAVLNSALPLAPDDTRQKMFNKWLEDLTASHIKILMLFGQPRNLPQIDLDDNKWEMVTAEVEKLGNMIEEAYPEMKAQFPLYIQIVRDLRSYNLLANRFPAKNMLTKIEYSPKPTKLAREFLAYIKSPLDES